MEELYVGASSWTMAQLHESLSFLSQGEPESEVSSRASFCLDGSSAMQKSAICVQGSELYRAYSIFCPS